MGSGQIVFPHEDAGGLAGSRARPRARTLGPLRPALRVAEPTQPELPFPPQRHLFVHEAARQSLEKRLQKCLKEPVLLSVTDNKRTMISSSRPRGMLRVRLHHMFLDADPFTVLAIARYVGSQERHASAVLSRYIDAQHHRIAPNVRRPHAIDPVGRVHDLDDVLRTLNRDYFGGSIDVAITWSRRVPRRKRASIKLGSYSQGQRLVRIHPALDQPFVPRYFVEWIVHHELLHHVVPMPLVDGRRQHHTSEFRSRERAFRHHRRAQRWEREHLSRLLAT